MKNVGLIVLMVGVSLCALFGARNPESVDARTRAGGNVLMTSIALGGAWAGVCAETKGLAGEENAEACQAQQGVLPLSLDAEIVAKFVESLRESTKEGESAKAVGSWLDAVEKGEADMSEEVAAALAAQGVFQLNGVIVTNNPAFSVMPDAEAWGGEDESRKAASERMAKEAKTAIAQQPKAFQTAFSGYLEALSSNHVAKLDAGAMVPPAVGARLGAWFSLAGLPFLAGLIMIIAGGLISRRALKDEVSSKATDDKSAAGPIDFAEALAHAKAEAARLGAEVQGKSTAEELDVIKVELEALQTDYIEPLVEARDRVTLLYGLAGFAAIFGPFSAGERKLNRAWATLVDVHPPEAQASFEAAVGYLGEALVEVERLVEERKSSD